MQNRSVFTCGLKTFEPHCMQIRSLNSYIETSVTSWGWGHALCHYVLHYNGDKKQDGELSESEPVVLHSDPTQVEMNELAVLIVH